MNMKCKMEIGEGDHSETVSMESKVEVPANQVYDNVGHGNPGNIFTGWKSYSGEIDIGPTPLNIYIDTVAPTADYEIVTREGCYRAGQEVKGKFGFSERILIGKIKYKFGTNGKMKEASANFANNDGSFMDKGNKAEFSAVIEDGENGQIELNLNELKDFAGNSVKKIKFPNDKSRNTDYMQILFPQRLKW